MYESLAGRATNPGHVRAVKSGKRVRGIKDNCSYNCPEKVPTESTSMLASNWDNRIRTPGSKQWNSWGGGMSGMGQRCSTTPAVRWPQIADHLTCKQLQRTLPVNQNAAAAQITNAISPNITHTQRVTRRPLPSIYSGFLHSVVNWAKPQASQHPRPQLHVSYNQQQQLPHSLFH